jgi:hypothetical protein
MKIELDIQPERKPMVRLGALMVGEAMVYLENDVELLWIRLARDRYLLVGNSDKDAPLSYSLRSTESIHQNLLGRRVEVTLLFKVSE